MSSLQQTSIPTDRERELAVKSSRSLARHLSRVVSSDQRDLKIRVEPDDNSGESAVIPVAAFQLLIDILTEMGQGNAISLIPHHAELTTQQSADFLNVSRPYLIGLLESGEIGYHKVGTHRRVLFQDLIEYKQKVDAARLDSLQELADQAQELDMGY